MPNTDSSNLTLPEGWRWHMEDHWDCVVRCARQDGRRGPQDVYLTDDDILCLDGINDAPKDVALAVLGVKP